MFYRPPPPVAWCSGGISVVLELPFPTHRQYIQVEAYTDIKKPIYTYIDKGTVDLRQGVDMGTGQGLFLCNYRPIAED